ncbi:MAG: alpha/beta hydrolase [Phycisphaerales bacterium]
MQLLRSIATVSIGLCASTLPAAAQSSPATEADEKAVWVTRAVQATRVEHHTFASAATATAVSYHLYVPAAYTAEPERRFPVVYWLHGSGGGLSGIAKVARRFDEAIAAGELPPLLVVFVNGLAEGMYVDWKDGSRPVESMIVKDLVPHIDASFRTLAAREGRLLDGFSMGGYGAARLGFKFPETFRAVSIVGAGPMQEELTRTPRANRARAESLLRRVYGGEQAHFRAVSPRTLATENAEVLARDSLVRIVIGDKDETYRNNVAFHEHLESLKIPHEWKVLPGVAHDPMAVVDALGAQNWTFYRAAFGAEREDATKPATDRAGESPPRVPTPAPASAAPAPKIGG